MKYIIGFIAVILALIFLIVVIAGRGNDDTRPVPGEVSLAEYADKGRTDVRYAISGPVVAEENHREIRFTISANTRSVEVVQGYQNTIVNSRVYGNNQAAYKEFLEALEQAGFATKRDSAAEDMVGVCPTGRRYTYLLREGSEDVTNLWSASCSRTRGSFAGTQALVENLFKAQIPDYTEISRGVRL